MAYNATGTTWHLRQYHLLGMHSQPGLSFSGTDAGNLCLCIEGSWLFVIHNGCIIENINLLAAHKNVKGIMSNNVMILTSTFSAFSRQFSVTFSETAGGSSMDHCSACVAQLQNYLQFFDMNGSPVPCAMMLPEMFKNFVEQQTSKGSSAVTALSEAFVPDGIPLEDVIKMILTDPGFGPLVARVQQFFQNVSSEKATTQISSEAHNS